MLTRINIAKHAHLAGTVTVHVNGKASTLPVGVETNATDSELGALTDAGIGFEKLGATRSGSDHPDANPALDYNPPDVLATATDLAGNPNLGTEAVESPSGEKPTTGNALDNTAQGKTSVKKARAKAAPKAKPAKADDAKADASQAQTDEADATKAAHDTDPSAK